MKKRMTADYRGIVLLSLFVLGAVVALTILPYKFQSEAGKKTAWRTESFEPGFDNYDIRTDKGAADFIAGARQSAGRSAELVGTVRENFTKGEETLRQSIPTLKVEYNEDIRTPEVIAPDINQGFKTMTGASTGVKNAETLRNFIRQNNDLVGVDDRQASQLKVTADYTNPDGNLSYAHLEQFIGDIPVFRAEIKAGFTKNGEMFRVINNLAPGLSYDALSSDFGDPAGAVQAAFTKVTRRMTADDTTLNEAASTNLKAVFGNGDWATTAEKMYFPTEPGVAVPAWRILIWQPVNAYYVIVDAQTGTMLWRKNLGNDQLQSSTYEVYQAPTSWSGIAGSPATFSPGPLDPTLGAQAPIGTRSNFITIGNEGPNSFNNNGWITDGNNTTDGNNLEAGLDLDGNNVIDAGSQATGSPNRVFTSLWNPPPGNPGPGDAPTAAEARRGAVIQMFYVMNRYHDELYKLGFTEQARNFQANNFGRGGVQGDRVSAEGQDSSGTNNANFNAGADGTRGRMQMFVWTGPSPQRDGTGDAEVIIHEVTHGTSNRLHNNNAGLNTNMSGGMGEGWGDFFGHVMLSRPSEPLDSVNVTGGYVLLNGFGTVGNKNYYYGIRRFPKARMSFTGGPQNRPHNPMTFADIDSNQINVTNGAFPAMTGPHISTTPDQVHAAGEVWSSALWEVRCQMVARLGFPVGSTKVLQLVTDGMKLDPNGPTFLQARDAIIAAAAASARAPEAAADVADVREGFRIRGMGFSASIQTATSPARVTEAFDTPNARVTNPITFTDPGPGGNNNGFADPGETIVFSVPVTNTTGATVTNVTVSANGGPAVNYGSVANAATVSNNIPFTISPAQPCGSTLTVTFTLNSDSGTQTPVTKDISIGQPIIGFTENFDGVTAPALPAGWTTSLTGTGVAPTTSTTNPSSAPNDAFLQEQATVGTNALETPAILINSASAQLTFKNLFNLENTFDGMVLEISNPAVSGGAYQDIITAGGSFVSGGYRAGIVQSGTCTDPFNGRQAWTGLSGGTTAAPTYIDSVVNLPASANGQSIKLRFMVGSDCSVTGTATPGARIDSIVISTGSSCPSVVVNSDSRADFDGDGKTDLSVFRPSDGNWYLNRSTDGFTVANWGIATDTPAPADYDGDDKTDVAVFRPSDIIGVPDFLVLNSATNTLSGMEFGSTGDIPVSGDVNGDDSDDYIVYRPTTGVWYTMVGPSTVTITPTGTGLTPLSGDFDGDNKADVALYNPSSSTFSVTKSGGGSVLLLWGLPGDKPVIADYDGDGKDDIAVFRPSDGMWYVHGSLGADIFTLWGVSTDVPVPGDYDGDGKDDVAVYRNGVWYINKSLGGIQITSFGLAADKAIPNTYLH
ncbi:MAG TPA: M36 family metallopeptidase [Pyrinomonadaceae bacterium]|jgi:hypothetical protein|nr:M36 family metallopeptidase [Pyrinomonadaceae bacterium]